MSTWGRSPRSRRPVPPWLRGLERDGLLTRTVHPVVPPRVDYALTELGRSLYALVEGLEKWAETHI